MRNSDYKKRLIDYIKKNLAKGYTEDSLRWALMSQGYSRTIIEESFRKTHEELAQKAPVLKTKPQIRYEIVDEQNRPINFHKPFWKRWLGL